MAGIRIANPATRVTQSSPSLPSREETEQPAVVEWNAKRRRLVLRVFNTKTADRQQYEAVARGPTPLYANESSDSTDHDAQVAGVGPGPRRYRPNSFGPQPRIDTQYGNSVSAFQSNGLESNSKQFEPVRTVGGGEGYDKRHRAEKPTFDRVVGNTIRDTGGRLEHDSRQDGGEVDLGAQHRAQVIAARPNFQSNESETVNYYAGTKKSFPQRTVHNRKSGRVHDDSSAFLLYPGTVNIKRHPTHLNRIHKSKGSVDYLLKDERSQRKRGVGDSSFLDSIILEPLDDAWITLDHYRTRDLEHRATGRRGTMNKFPSKRPSTPEHLKGLSAKHLLKTLREKDGVTELRRYQQTSEARRRDWSPPEMVVVEEDLVEEEDDYTDTRTASTNSSSTVYLIRTVKKPNRYGSNGRTHTKKAEPEPNQTAEPHRRRAILEPVTPKGNPDDKDRGQRARPKKTKRVKNSVTQTSEDTLQDDTPAAAENTPMPRFITPRKQKRSVGLQTVIEEDLRAQASTNPDSIPSRIIRPTKTTIAIQTDIPKTAKPTKTTVATQTLELETASKATSVRSLTREQKEKQDFSGQTENLPTFDQKTSEREQAIQMPPLRRPDQEAPDVNWPTPAIQPLQSHETLNTGREEIPAKRKAEGQTVTTNGITDDQNQLVYGLQHEVRLLRHENYYLRQQLDYPIKPKGRLQRQNEDKILQIIRHLESQGPTGKLTSQIREGMMHEAMIENDILRSENSDLQTTLDQTRRLQETLSTENEQLRKQIQLQQQKMALQDADKDHRQMAPDDVFERSHTYEADDIDATRSVQAPKAFVIYNSGAAEPVTMTTTAPRTHAATKQTRIPKLSSGGEFKKSEVRK